MEVPISDDVEQEEISESFICPVCLDLLYKPIALACGHISCFWCVHHSMDGLQVSHCPLCRHPYNHFPNVCQMLHLILLKMYPIACNKRDHQIMEEEKRTGYFSPQLGAHLCGSHTNEELNHMGTPTESSSLDTCSTSKGERGNMDQSELDTSGKTGNISVEKQDLCADNHNQTMKKVSVNDVLCAACKQLLFRPVVLNCGHVYCESCIILPMDKMVKCQACQSPQPKGIPKICLELDKFLKEYFPKEYEARRALVQLKQEQTQRRSSNTRAGWQGVHSSSLKCEDYVPWWQENASNIHFAVGCDYCGMCPIIGVRYRCKDCEEKIGFDLCENCYNTRSNLTGRFNQQHTSKHQFEKKTSSDSIRNMMLRLVAGHVDDSPTRTVSSDTNASEGTEYGDLSSLNGENRDDLTDPGPPM